MGKIKNFKQFVNETLEIDEEELSKIADMVDDVYYKDGDKFAFVDFKGIKNIPVNIKTKQLEEELACEEEEN